jgi:Vacuolar protein sorting-associated protein 26
VLLLLSVSLDANKKEGLPLMLAFSLSYLPTGECIPIRLFLSSIDLTPTYRSINNRFSVKYYLNLVLVDEEDRRYFKQQEVTLWRKEIG